MFLQLAGLNGLPLYTMAFKREYSMASPSKS